MYHICKEKHVNLSLFSMSRKALLAVTVLKFWIDYHLKLSPVTELGSARFLQLLKLTLELKFNGPILMKVSKWDLKRAPDWLKLQKVHFNGGFSDVQLTLDAL